MKILNCQSPGKESGLQVVARGTDTKTKIQVFSATASGKGEMKTEKILVLV